jgi:hypothetical protein
MAAKIAHKAVYISRNGNNNNNNNLLSDNFILFNVYN